MFNGDWIGFHDKPEILVESIREARRARKGFTDPIEVSVNWDITNKEIKIFTD